MTKRSTDFFVQKSPFENWNIPNNDANNRVFVAIDMDFLKSDYRESDYQLELQLSRRIPAYWVYVLMDKHIEVSASDMINRMDLCSAIKGSDLSINNVKEWGQAMVILSRKDPAYQFYLDFRRT